MNSGDSIQETKSSNKGLERVVQKGTISPTEGRTDADWPYLDIRNRKYPEAVELPKPRMSKLDRAAQFAPFAALTGHEEVLEETAQIAASRKSVISEEIYDFP